MKKFSRLFGALAVASLVAAPISGAFADTGKSKTHEMNVTIVAINAEAKTMTVKMDNGDEKTAPVLQSAQAKMKNVKVGEKVTLTCTDKPNGDHEGISDIKVPKEAKTSTKK